MDGYFVRLPGRGAHADFLAGAQLCSSYAEVSENEVRVFGIAIRAEENIGGLDIAVDDGFEVLWTPAGLTVVAGVDVGKDLGELLVSVPDEGFGNPGVVATVGVNEVLEVAVRAVFVPDHCEGFGEVVGLHVDDEGVAVEDVHEDVDFLGSGASGFVSAMFHDLADEVLAVVYVFVEIAVTLATNTDVFDKLVLLIFDVAVFRMVRLQICDGHLSPCRTYQVSCQIWGSSC